MSSEKKPKTFENEAKFVATRMSLPLFMVSRNRIRVDHLHRSHKQFKLAGTHYNKLCVKENRGIAASKATYDRYKRILGEYNDEKFPYPVKRPLRSQRYEKPAGEWKLAPNQYPIPPEPYKSQSGSKGTVFAKMNSNKSINVTKPPDFQYYHLPTNTEQLLSREQSYRGVFQSNAREHRPSTRLMVSSLSGCWKNPKDPGPTSYYPQNTDISYNVKPPTTELPPNPHLFYRHSCVPQMLKSIYPRHVSFRPAPGRYDIRYPNICPCAPNKISMPGLQLQIDEQKRLKFRRLPYKCISRRMYCEPDWRHVAGQGHTRLFRMSQQTKQSRAKQKKAAPDTKKVDKELQLYADSKYINMITHPQQTFSSFRQAPLEPYVPRIQFNCNAKRTMRKQLRNNKKIAFLSGQERFKGADRPPQLTVSQLEAIKEKLPLDRRLYDRPLTYRSSAVLPKFMYVPEHQRNVYLPKLRKRLFKFLPIPGPRLLVTDSDIHPEVIFDQANPSGLYRRTFDETQFYRDFVLMRMQQEKEKMQKQQSRSHESEYSDTYSREIFSSSRASGFSVQSEDAI